ncbi:hypothetical protein HDU97_004440 [Phlyctochytrium planicorne]|nr:hypothetical protein HDU97_004440 [Phlyctochytrium planicorne]
MVAVTTILALVSVVGGSILNVQAKVHVRSHGPTAIPGAYLVEVPRDIEAEDHVKSHLASFGIHNVTIRQKISMKFFNGVSFKINSDTKSADREMSLVSNIPRILNAFKVHRVLPSKPRVITTEGLEKYAVEGIHILTGVNQARNELGLTGKGIKVAIIDSGIDYNHEALGGGFGPGFKVSFGYDLVGDNYPESKIPDADPFDNCDYYAQGTFTAGIVGADARTFKTPRWKTDVPFTGVAPEVTLGAYRVSGCQGETATDVITEAIYRAAEDGADIISISYGSEPTYKDGPASDAATRVGAEKHYVFAAQGDNGYSGLMAGGSPSVAAGGFGVASFNNLESPKTYLTFGGKNYETNFGFNDAFFNFSSSYEIVANDINADDTINNEDGLHGINPAVKGKTALIRWAAGNPSGPRCTNAFKAGAIACILYITSDIIPERFPGSPSIPSLATTHESGKAMVGALKASKGSPVTVSISNKLTQFNIANAGTVTDISSPGLDQELFIKPDYGALGGSIYSTVSAFVRKEERLRQPYAVYTGTAMSSAYAAGVAALLLQSYGDKRPDFEDFRTRLQNTANFAKKHGTDLIDSVAYQGAGLINAYQAANAKTVVCPSRLALNDTKHIKDEYTIKVTNKNKAPVTYTIQHQPALMVTPFKAGDDAMLSAFDQTYTADYATVKFSDDNDKHDVLGFTLNAGETKSFNVSFDPPPKAVAGLFPVYSGYIVVSVDGKKAASVPYAGMVGKWKDAPIWSRHSKGFDLSLQTSVFGLSEYGITVAPNATLPAGLYVKDGFHPVTETTVFQNISSTGAYIAPVASTNSRLAMVEAIYKGNDWKRLNDLGIDRDARLIVAPSKWAMLTNSPKGSLFDSKADPLFSPLARNSYQFFGQSLTMPKIYFWYGKVLKNTVDETSVVSLPPGPYQLRCSALKHFAKISAPVGGSDYDTILTPTFTIV